MKKKDRWVSANKVTISVQDETFEALGKVEAEFKAGETYELNEFSAYHWITRNAAVEVDAKSVKTLAPETASVKPPETAEAPKARHRKPPLGR